MNKTQELLNQFANAFPDSWHIFDKNRFKDFVICSFKEWKIYEYDILVKELLNFKWHKQQAIFTEEQARNFTNKYSDYIDLLKLYNFRQNNDWNFDINYLENTL